MEFNIRWLENKGYVKSEHRHEIVIGIVKKPGELKSDSSDYKPELCSVKYICIKSKGVDHIEEGKNFSSPEFSQQGIVSQSIAANITVQGPNYGAINAVAGQENTISSHIKISEAFNEAEKALNADTLMTLTEKVQIRIELNELKDELFKEEKANKGKLEQGFGWLKQHAFEIATIVQPFILKALGR